MPRPPLFVFFVLVLSMFITAVGYAENDNRHAGVFAPVPKVMNVEGTSPSPHPGKAG
ncbi:hypothetical protein [Sagittula stellata]|uniref:Uncharacterized protein n=1 Tax=Sagittula stellata (strain ATCC 700073 / DSM 11524 / E-37) TaxID=388399 RepID=A3JZI9_SAGS3|nr:hypothetical protein [Sagittula stellata]EBA09892.1 hypothetical protein SSE37_08788 [Sagittula stellata E-37]